MKPTTLEEALSLVPTHWPLTQDVGDNCRRPIPQDVRESIAEMILHAARDTAKDSAWAEDILGRWILTGKP